MENSMKNAFYVPVEYRKCEWKIGKCTLECSNISMAMLNRALEYYIDNVS